MLSPNNLPLQLTSFIGRQQQIAEVRHLLSTSRLLTLTGAGGSGKTRLAVEVASQVLDHFPDGVFFVNLAPITDANLVVSSIAQTLDVKEAAGQPLLETLKAHLHDKEMLLVLDNFEQVVDAAPMLNELLLGTTYLKVLVTSRVVLHLYGEQQYHVPPLQVPDAGPGQKVPSLESLSEYEAVRLFVERARAARSDFSLTDGNAQAVAELCARLDGLPLAIELAAARVRVLTPQTMLPRLESRLKLLTSGEISRPARQQTLSAAIEWSYDLLTEGEKQLFRRMAVFQGGCSLEAVEAVCNYDGSLQVEVLEGVTALVDKNLLQQREGSGGEARFWMLETIHEYAREKLQESGEAEALQKEHALYFMCLAEEGEPYLLSLKQQEWLRRLEEEHDNLRVAIQWARESGNAEDTEVGLKTGAAIWRLWQVRGYYSEGRKQLQGMLSQAALLGGSKMGRAKALHGAGNLAGRQGDYTSARSLLQDALALGKEIGDKESIGLPLYGLASLALSQGDYVTARSLYEESLTVAREIGTKAGIAGCLNGLGDVVVLQGDYVTARSLYEESLALWRELGQKGGIAVCLRKLAHLAWSQGNYPSARSLLLEGLALWKELRDMNGVASSFTKLGLVAQMQGDYPTARSLYLEGLHIWKEIGDKVGVARSLTGLGEVAVSSGQSQQGARVLSASHALLGAIGDVMAPDDRIRYDHAVATARSQLGEVQFEQAWQDGCSMSMEQAIEYALQDMPEPGPEPVAKLQAAQTPRQSYPNELTHREVEVLRLLVEGLSNERIAERLFLSTNTVRSHLYSIYSKLGVPNRAAATRFAVDHRLV